jgi:hypothetical protein
MTIEPLYPGHEKVTGYYGRCPLCGTDEHLFECNTSNAETWDYCRVHRVKFCIRDLAALGRGYRNTQDAGHRRNAQMLATFEIVRPLEPLPDTPMMTDEQAARYAEKCEKLGPIPWDDWLGA